MCPDGITVNCSSPMEGSRHDAALLDYSKLQEMILEDHRFDNYVLYGDPAYAQNLQCIIEILDQDQQQFNSSNEQATYLHGVGVLQ